MAEPTYSGVGWKLYVGDCLAVLPGLTGIDAVVTSPPYNRGSRIDGQWEGTTTASCKSRRFRGGYGDSCRDDMPWQEYREWMADVVSRLWSIGPETMWINHKPRIINGELWTPIELAAGLPLRQIIIWKTGPGVNFMPGAFVPSHEWVMLIAKNGWKFPKRSIGSAGDVWDIPPASPADHPAPFPVEVPFRCIVASGAETILDPFAGSGTTGVACIKAGRKFVGVEIHEHHAATAAKRLERAEAGKRNSLPFPEPEPRPKQVTMWGSADA